MIKIKSYLNNPLNPIYDLDDAERNPQNYFVEINDYKKIKKIKNNIDPEYLEGAIEMFYDNQKILGFRQWDDIDCLWSYLINLIEQTEEKNEDTTYFPNQPITIQLKKMSDNQIFLSITIHQEKHWIIPKKEFYNAIFSHARNFFKKLMFIFPSHIQDYQEELKRIDEVEQMTLQSKN